MRSTKIMVAIAAAVLAGGCFFTPTTELTEYSRNYDSYHHAWYESYFASATRGDKGQQAIISLFTRISSEVRHRSTPLAARMNSPGAYDVLTLRDGQCDEVSLAMITVAASEGFQGRLVGLFHVNGKDEHTVAEIFYDQAWHLFDPDHGVYYEKDGRILSFDDLQRDPSIVANTVDPMGFDSAYMSGFYVKGPLYHNYMKDMNYW